MHKIIATALIALGVSMWAAAPAQAWYCRATSPQAWGEGWGSLRYARNRALAECAIRTPRWSRCYIRYCN
ncbi:MAG: hypothetical protein P4L82_02515 [Ancalomicrobiaceae bacterium]|nr:hypothetical protein [Ancalomicrobiaceae bacterium]